VRQLSQRRPEPRIEVFRTDWYDQTEVILDGQVDVGYLRRPFDPRGLAIEPFLEEPHVVSLQVDHRLAGKATVSVTDLADLVTQHEDLRILRMCTAGQQSQPGHDLPEDQIQ
jgi:DNA-binding transcriptional LysR family regulator